MVRAVTYSSALRVLFLSAAFMVFGHAFAGGGSDDNTQETKTVRIYPQPFRSNININWGSEIPNRNVTVQVFDLLGQLRYEDHYSELNSENLSVDLSELNSGVYLITISSTGSKQTFKVTKL